MNAHHRRSSKRNKSVVWIASGLPVYREEYVRELRAIVPHLEIMSGSSLMDTTVRTGISEELYTPVKNRLLFGKRLLIQTGVVVRGIKAETTLVELNPRILTNWTILLARRVLRRRSLVWGPLFSRKGPDSPTNCFRRALRRMTNGTILYDFASVNVANAELPDQPVWVAPNAIYRKESLGPGPQQVRDSILYIGRLVPEKKPELLLRAFAKCDLAADGAMLVIAGNGPQFAELSELTRNLGLVKSVKLLGTVTDVDGVRELYDSSFCATSPGYAGLNVTQSLGFGVPIVVADDEPHAPEIELSRFPGVHFFHRDIESDLADILTKLFANRGEVDYELLARPVKELYSVENMAKGMSDALLSRTKGTV